jgi:hypothetical protein
VGERVNAVGVALEERVECGPLRGRDAPGEREVSGVDQWIFPRWCPALVPHIGRGWFHEIPIMW